MTTAQQELADQIEQSCHVTIEHGLVGGTILTKDKLDTIVTALRAHDDMLTALKEAEECIAEGVKTLLQELGVNDERIRHALKNPGADGSLAKIRAAILLAESQS